MLSKSFNSIGGHQSQSSSSDILKEEETHLPYGNFPVPFVRVSQTVKRFKPGTDDMVRRKSTKPSQTISRCVDTFKDLESHLGINSNQSQLGDISEILQSSNLKITGMEGLPHPNQLSCKKNRQTIRRPSATPGNDINEHMLQLQRKKQLLGETKLVESVLVTRNQISSDSVRAQPIPNVVLETTKQYFLTFEADSTLSWTSSRVSSLSSTALAREGKAPGGAMPWEGLVASVQRQVVCTGGQQDGVVAVCADRKRKLQSPALDSPLDHFLGLYRSCLQQTADDDDDDEFDATRYLGPRHSRPQGFAFRKNSSHMFASNAQPAILQSTGICSGNDFPGQRTPSVSADRSTMAIMDQIHGLNERADVWGYESPYQTYKIDNSSSVREE